MSRVSVLGFMSNVQGESWLHKLDPRTKVALLAFFSVVPLFFTAPLVLIGFVVLTLPLWLTARIKFRSMVGPLLGVGFFLLVMFALNAIKGPSELTMPDPNAAFTKYWQLGPIVVTDHTLLHASFKGLRVLVPLTIGLLIVATTDPTSMAKGFRKIGIPVDAVFMALAALRFIPIMVEQIYNILDAMTIRGVRSSRIARTKLLIFPLVITSLRRTRTMGLACEARGFGARRWNNFYQKFRLTNLDKTIMIALLIATVVLIVLRLGFGFGVEAVGYQK